MSERRRLVAAVVGVVVALGVGAAVLLAQRGGEGPDSAAIGSRVNAETTTSTTTSTSPSTTTTSTTASTTTTTTAPPLPTRPHPDEVPVPPADAAPDLSERTVVRNGTGTDPAAEGDTVVFRFVGRLPGGEVFVDSWVSDATPIGFVLGRGDLRAGLDRQLRGLVAGDRAEIVLGSEQAFGATGDGTGAVPPDTPVAYLVDVFDVIVA